MIEEGIHVRLEPILRSRCKAGRREGSSLESQGDFGYYWSSSLFTYDPEQARYTSFGENGVFGSPSSRTDGKSIRPVYEE